MSGRVSKASGVTTVPLLITLLLEEVFGLLVVATTPVVLLACVTASSVTLRLPGVGGVAVLISMTLSTIASAVVSLNAGAVGSVMVTRKSLPSVVTV